MATSSKFDLSSSSPDRPLYTGQRGSHIATSLDRSVSFRESMENPIISTLPSMSRSNSLVTPGEVLNFFQCLRFDPKFVAAEHKSNRHSDLRRHVNDALGITTDESSLSSSKGKLLPSPIPEEIKRVKAGLRESSVKARERMKIFNEALSVFNKFFPSLPSKKRSRTEGFCNDRGNAVLSDRSAIGPSMSKVGNQNHITSSGFVFEQQKSEERTKNAPSKRTRTSLVDVRMDVRSSAAVRPSGAVDREKEMLRIANGGAGQGDDRTLTIGVEGWEKSKMKKKRSVIKADVSPSTGLTKSVDGFRESKQGLLQRSTTDARSKMTNDSHAFRSGVANAQVGIGKSDANSHQNNLGSRSSTPRTDQDNNSLVNDRRDRPVGSDKERVNLRAINKTTVHDEFNTPSPTSSTKMNASARAPRSGSLASPKLSTVVQRTAIPNEWELTQCTNKPPAVVGANNRKRVASARSSSPPVAHWAGQRPQKISRTARRTNLVPIVPSNDEIPASDAISDVTGNDTGFGLPKRLPNGSPQQLKLKGDTFSSAALSESDESGVAEVKSKDKCRKPEEIDQKTAQNVQKVSNMVPPSRKNKLVSGEEHGDGVRRQGRTGRVFTSTRSLTPMTVEKLGNVGTAKQLRSARLGFEKSESKAGRPPTRKLSDRKAYTRHKNSAMNAAADLLVGSDDGNEELVAAVNAVVNPGGTFSSPFWRQTEPFFGLISDADISYLKQQAGNLESAPMTAEVLRHLDDQETIDEGSNLRNHDRDIGLATERSEPLSELIPAKGDYSVIPLCQRLIAALIPEEDGNHRSEGFKLDEYGSEYELDGDFESNSSNNQTLYGFNFSGHSAYLGYGTLEHEEGEGGLVGGPLMGWNSFSSLPQNGLFADKTLMPSLASSELHYDHMDINEKLLMEIQSIGIFPEPVPSMAQMEDEGINKEISSLQEQYHEQFYKKKGLIDSLLKSASTAKELQEKQFDQRAFDKLVTMAYQKYTACRPSAKHSSGKLAKQAALAFVKRTLDRCHQFEDFGISCFSDLTFRSMFTCQLNSSQPTTACADAESSRPYSSSHSLEAKISASIASLQSPSYFSQNIDNQDLNSLDITQPINHPLEEINGKDETWSHRVKKRELSLDDVGGAIGNSNAPSAIGSSLSSNAKGKRSERDRDGKGHSLSRNETTKAGRPTLSSTKGERKSKTKPKQRTTQLSFSVNGFLGKMPDQPKSTLPSLSKSNEVPTNGDGQRRDELGVDGLEDPIDLSHLQLPGMDILGVPDDLGGQGQDLDSWLNIDDDGSQDQDFMGLEIPMDDLADLNMMV